jgi:hypothetical protein
MAISLAGQKQSRLDSPDGKFPFSVTRACFSDSL